MDVKIVKTAKELPAQLKSVWDSMFEQSEHALRVSVTALRSSLGKLENYLKEVEKEHLGASAAAAATGPAPKAAPVRKRRRRGKRFPTGDFVIAELGKSPKGVRPRIVADALMKQAPGRHKDPLAVVNTTLKRLKDQKQAVNLGGVWALARKG